MITAAMIKEKAKEDDAGAEFLGLIMPDGDDSTLDKVLSVLESYPGEIRVIIAKDGKKYSVSSRIRKCDALLSELKGLLPEKDIVFLKKKS